MEIERLNKILEIASRANFGISGVKEGVALVH